MAERANRPPIECPTRSTALMQNFVCKYLKNAANFLPPRSIGPAEFTVIARAEPLAEAELEPRPESARQPAMTIAPSCVLRAIAIFTARD